MINAASVVRHFRKTLSLILAVPGTESGTGIYRFCQKPPNIDSGAVRGLQKTGGTIQKQPISHNSDLREERRALFQPTVRLTSTPEI
jgi:hypothetical protein